MLTDIEKISTSRKINTQVFQYAKYALGVLTIFIVMTFYQTIYDNKKTPKLRQVDDIKSTSISTFQTKLNQVLGTLSTSENETPVYPMQWITRKNSSAILTLKPDIDVQISENTKLQIRSKYELFLKFGSIKVLTKESEVRIFSNEWNRDHRKQGEH